MAREWVPASTSRDPSPAARSCTSASSCCRADRGRRPHAIFEPRWDGFRTLVFRDGDDIFLQSRDEKPLARYYPELLAPLAAQHPSRCVLDGEPVIVQEGALDFDALQLRLHPVLFE